MSRQLFVHVGPPKTASSSIQWMLKALAPELASKGVLYPGTGRNPYVANHQHLVLSQLDARRGKWGGNDPWAALEAEIRGSPANRIVISAEGFAGTRRLMNWPARIASLAEAVDADVRIIAYVRPQYKMLESRYSQYSQRYMAQRRAALARMQRPLRSSRQGSWQAAL